MADPFVRFGNVPDPLIKQEQAQQLNPPVAPATPPIELTPDVGDTPKPLFFDEGDTITPPFQSSTRGTERTVERTESDFDMDAAAQRLDEAGQFAADRANETRAAGIAGNMAQQGALERDRATQQGELGQAENRAADLQKQMAKLDATKIDESDFWRDAGSGRTVAAALALAAGGFVNAIRPGSNNVTEVIYGAVERYTQRKVAEKNEQLKRRADLLGDEKLAIRMLKADLRKSILDQAALQAQQGQLDAEYTKTLARLYYDNVKDLNTLAAQTAGKTSVAEKAVEKPGSPTPWAQYGMDQKRWDRFVQGDDKKAGAAALVTGVRELNTTRQYLDKLAAAEKGELANYGAFEQLLPEALKDFSAKLGVDASSNMIEVRQIVNRKVLEFVRTMNSRLVDSNHERERMESFIARGDTVNVFRGLEAMQAEMERDLKNRATEAQVPGVDPGDMIRYVAQQRAGLDAAPTQRLRGPNAAPSALEQQQQGLPTMDTINRVEPGREQTPQQAPITGAGYTPEKRRALSTYAATVGLDASKLERVINVETAGSFDPAQENLAGSSATGIGQWMKSNYPGGRSRDEVKSMSFQEQLEHLAYQMRTLGVDENSPLEDYYAVYAAPGILKQYGSMARVPSHLIIYPAGSKEAEANKGWQDSEGNVTGASLKAFIEKKSRG